MSSRKYELYDGFQLFAARCVVALASVSIVIEGGHPVWIFSAAVWSLLTLWSVVSMVQGYE